MTIFCRLSILLIMSSAILVNAEETEKTEDVTAVQSDRFTSNEVTPAGTMFSNLMANTPAGFSLSSWMAVGNGGLADVSLVGASGNGTVGVNQLGISMKKSGEKVSFQMDALYGRDAGYFQGHHNDGNNWDNSAGFDRGAGYALALPQFYMTTNYGDTTLKLGHFLADSHTGHYSTDRFFATRTGAETLLSPYTLNGVVVHRTIGQIDYHIGWSSGINVAFNTMAGSMGENPNVTAEDTLVFGAKTNLGENTRLRYNGYTGALSGSNARDMLIFSEKYSHDFSVSHKVTDKLTLEFYYGTKQASWLKQQAFRQSAFYQLNDKMTIGQRYEVVRGIENGSTHTVGLNIHSNKLENLTLRPEIRYSKVGTADNTSFFMDAVLTY